MLTYQIDTKYIKPSKEYKTTKNKSECRKEYPGLEGIKLCSVLGAQKSCSKHEIQQFDWLIFESEYENHARKFYDREARSSCSCLIHCLA